MNTRSSFVTRTLNLLAMAVLAFFISEIAGGVWSFLLISNLRSSPTIPWSVLTMAVLLWLMWKYLGGSGWPSMTSELRRQDLRANQRPLSTYIWALLAGALAVGSLAGIWIVLSQLVKMPPNALPDVSSYPRITIALMVLMASLVAPLMEEAAFRGYLQVALEREFRGSIAVVLSSLVFALAHYNHGLVWPKFLVYFLTGVTFGTIAYLTNSTLPAIAPHMFGDLTFFIFVWPHDATRRLFSESGGDRWFWVHAAQAIVFGVLSIWAFRQLAKRATREVSPAEAKMVAAPSGSVA